MSRIYRGINLIRNSMDIHENQGKRREVNEREWRQDMPQFCGKILAWEKLSFSVIGQTDTSKKL